MSSAPAPPERRPRPRLHAGCGAVVHHGARGRARRRISASSGRGAMRPRLPSWRSPRPRRRRRRGPWWARSTGWLRCPRTGPRRDAARLGQSTGWWRSRPARLALTPELAAERNPLDAAVTAARAQPSGAAAAALQADFEARILPQLDRIAAAQPSAPPRRAGPGARGLLAASLALQLADRGRALLRRRAAGAAPDRRLDGAQRRGGPRDPLPAAARPADRHAERRLLPRPPRAPRGGHRPGAARRRRCSGSTSTASRCCARRSGSATCRRGAPDRGAPHPARRCRAGDFAAYLGQDDFVVVAGELDDGNDAAMIAARVQAALAKPFSIRGGARRLTCSIGVTLLSDDRPGRRAGARQRRDRARRGAGRGPRQRPLLPRGPAPRGRAARGALRRAACTGSTPARSLPFFQPQVELATGALLPASRRWCAGSIPSTACWSPTPSSTSPSRPTSASGSASWC